MRRRAALLVLLPVLLFSLFGCLVTGPRAAFTASPWFGYPPLGVSFDASASTSPNGEIVSYEWDFGDGATDEGRTANHTFAEKGIYPVNLTITDASNGVARVTHNVQAMSLPPSATFSYSPYMAPRGMVVTFDGSLSVDPDGDIVDYVWDFGDGSMDVGVVVEHVFTQATKYAVRLTVIDDDGVSDSVEKPVTITGCNICG
jgi:PKD repeat protein